MNHPINPLKSDFPVFRNHPALAYLDNTASSQKPDAVIEGVKRFLEFDYANIHRGAYALSERSEHLYEHSKEKVRDLIGAASSAEIIYTYNSTYAVNLLSLSLARSGMLKKGDRVLVSIAEHHANVVPWLVLKEWFGVEVDYFGMTNDFEIDFADIDSKMTPDTKVVAVTSASNVTGAVFDVASLGRHVSEMRDRDGNKPLFVVDARQAVPNYAVDVKHLHADFLFFTAHKMMADTGLGVLYGRKDLLKSIQPALSGGGAINWVKKEAFAPAGLPYRFEPGTPNVIGAVSLLHAIEYFESIGGYARVEEIEKPLIAKALDRFAALGDKVRLIGPKDPSQKIGIFSFTLLGVHVSDLTEHFAKYDVCVRSGYHCAEPLAAELGIDGTVRMSLYLYNDENDLDAFFSALEGAIASAAE
ncbi:MAG: cysteine desulfurase / selenocysteine lyase [Patescibacteria group bacterium]|nr:cysteine desulfurase / selenocysteine lyase [Patescibacteria group bacterium]